MAYDGITQFSPENIMGYNSYRQPIYQSPVYQPATVTAQPSAMDALKKAQEDAASKAGVFGKNLDTAKFGLDSLNALSGLYTGLQGLKQAKAQFNFQKEFANTNMANQIKAYNTALTDRTNARAVQEGNTSPQQIADYIKANQQVR